MRTVVLAGGEIQRYRSTFDDADRPRHLGLTMQLRIDGLDPGAQFANCDSIGDRLREYARQSPHSAAILFHDDASLSYSELQALIDDTSNLLFEAGLGRRSHIGISMSRFEFAALATILIACRSIAVPVDPRLLPEELNSLLGKVRLDAIIFLCGDLGPMRKAAENLELKIIELSLDHDGSFRLESHFGSGPIKSFAANRDPGDIAFILRAEPCMQVWHIKKRSPVT